MSAFAHSATRACYFAESARSATVAIWATWWIGGRTEEQIRRRALFAPLLTIAPWMVFSAYLSIRSGSAEMFAGLVALGSGMIVVLGYTYVGLTFLLRDALAGRIAARRNEGTIP